jgi:hypothetical protein
VKVVDFGSPPVQRLVGIIERTSNSKTHFVRALHGMLLGQAGEARDDTSR